MTPICNETMNAIASGAPLSGFERRHAMSCSRCQRAKEIPALVSAASRALCSIEPHIGFATSAVAIARARARRRRVTMLAGAFAVSAAAAIVLVLLWSGTSSNEAKVVSDQTPPPTEDRETWRLTQPAQDFEPTWILDHNDILTLSVQQREKLRDLVADLRKDVVAIAAKLQVEEIDLSRELRRLRPNRKKIAGHIDRIGKLSGQLRKIRTMAWLDARDLLTEDQRMLTSSLVGIESPPPTETRDKPRSDDGGRDDSDRVAELERKLEAERQARLELEKRLEKDKTRVKELEPYESIEYRRPENGKLMINSKPYSIVYIDGKRHGLTPVITELRPGRHKVVLTRPDEGVKKTYTVKIKPGTTTRITTRLDVPEGAD